MIEKSIEHDIKAAIDVAAEKNLDLDNLEIRNIAPGVHVVTKGKLLSDYTGEQVKRGSLEHNGKKYDVYTA